MHLHEYDRQEHTHGIIDPTIFTTSRGLCNEGIAIFRIKVGKEINSTALIADGYHARVDDVVSLGVFIHIDLSNTSGEKFHVHS